MDEQKQVRCPKCGSTDVHSQKRGYSIIKGLIGLVGLGLVFWWIAWPLALLGLLLGFADSQNVYITCLNCGHRWMAGQGQTNNRDFARQFKEDSRRWKEHHK
jgi:DNA-directed RNA polymerase subunit RPC12/RpoP